MILSFEEKRRKKIEEAELKQAIQVYEQEREKLIQHLNNKLFDIARDFVFRHKGTIAYIKNHLLEFAKHKDEVSKTILVNGVKVKITINLDE